MQFKNSYRVIGYRDVVFDILEFEVKRRSQIEMLYFDVARQINNRIIEKTIKLFDRMQARGRSCLMKVAISQPINRELCGALNDRRCTLTGLIPGPLPRSRIAVAAKVGAPAFVAERLLRYHAGDILISIDASIHGGIGPQHSSISMIFKH
ncbi:MULTISPECIES: hypothetical protein [Pseudomonas]|uniref:hypothetical protein n=1 Tax=Pseudomonas TaxID=286 RepID=UPI00301E27E8